MQLSLTESVNNFSSWFSLVCFVVIVWFCLVRGFSFAKHVFHNRFFRGLTHFLDLWEQDSKCSVWFCSSHALRRRNHILGNLNGKSECKLIDQGRYKEIKQKKWGCKRDFKSFTSPWIFFVFSAEEGWVMGCCWCAVRLCLGCCACASTGMWQDRQQQPGQHQGLSGVQSQPTGSAESFPFSYFI